MAKLDVKGIAILVLMILGSLFWWNNSRKLAEYEAMKPALDALKGQVGTLQSRQDAYDEAMQAKQDRADDARNTYNAIQRSLTEASRNDSSVADFRAAPIPDGVRAAYLRGQAAGPAAVGRAAGTDGHDGPVPDH